MVRPTRWALVIVAAAAGFGVACGGENGTPPTTPTPVPVTETFTGVLTPNSARVHTFSAVAGGSVTATLTAVPANTTVGVDLGTWNGSSCHVIISKTDAVQNSAVIGTVASAGDLCVRIYDVATLTDAAAYEVQVVHP